MGGSGWTRNGKPASPLRKGGRRRSNGRSGRSSSSCSQLDEAEEKREKKEKKKEQGRNEKGLAKRSETGPSAKGAVASYIGDRSLQRVYRWSLAKSLPEDTLLSTPKKDRRKHREEREKEREGREKRRNPETILIRQPRTM